MWENPSKTVSFGQFMGHVATHFIRMYNPRVAVLENRQSIIIYVNKTIRMAKKKAKSVKKSSPKKAASAAAKSAQSRSVKAPIQPLSDRVLVRREDMPDKKSAAGIVLPDSAQKEKSKMGVVLAVGPGRFGDEGDIIPMTVSVGDRVIFNAGWDNEVTMEDDREHFLVRETDILAVLN